MSNELDLRDYVRIIRKRLWLIAVIVIAACLVSGAFSIYFQKPIYEASTKIIVNQTASQAMLQQLDLNQINSNIRMIDTYKEIIKTPAILDKVVERYPEFDLTTEQLAEKVKVSSVNNTQVMTLAVQDLSYGQAAEIVNAVSLIFQQEIPTLFNIENVSILNKAKLDATPAPVSPNIPLNIAISFVVALMLGVGLSFLLEFLDDTVKTEEDVQRYLGLPTLGVITRMDQDDMKHASTRAASQSYKKAGELERVTIGK